ncbi:MAG: zf-HC2 domain-containing protein [Desulfamplus sp.]|nr:zf-HC2 domain-containing protein [Desulfamplus sp.]
MAVCNKYNMDIINCFVDRELDSDMNQEVKKHLETCLSCRQIAQEYDSFGDIFKSRINEQLFALDFDVTKSAIMNKIQVSKSMGQARRENSKIRSLAVIDSGLNFLRDKVKGVADHTKIRSILSKIISPFEKIYNRAISYMSDLLKIYPLQSKTSWLQMASLAGIIFLTVVYFQNSTFFYDSTPTVASLPQNSPSAIVTSVNGNVSSLMILESEDNKMTIIWYKEV